ncbi:MAG TPA: chemotaxis protein CheW [Burkholderiales bacterium]|nr:chemotaxis protein CheW [Burkholderiales bacterium]
MAAVTPFPAASSRTSERSVALRVHPELPLLLLGPGVIAQQLTDTPIAPIPNCTRWFCGVARHGGQIVPFFDVALWAGIERSGRGMPVMVSITAGTHSLGVLASESPIILPPGHAVAPWPDKNRLAADGPKPGTAIRFDPLAWLAEIATQITSGPS